MHGGVPQEVKGRGGAWCSKIRRVSLSKKKNLFTLFTGLEKMILYGHL